MWTELIERLGTGCSFGPPAEPNAIRDAEKRLAIKFPDDVRNLLLEANGVSGHYGTDLIWPVGRIVKNNVDFRSHPDFSVLYMPFDHLLFFGDDGGGDQFAYRILSGTVEDQGVFRWVHENDSREWFAGDLRDYLARSLGHDSYYSSQQ